MAWPGTTDPRASAHPGPQAWDAAGHRRPPPPGPGACPGARVGLRTPSQSPRHVGRGWGGAGGPRLRDAVCQHLTGVFVQPGCAAHGRLSPSLSPFPDSFGRPSRTRRVRGSPCRESPEPFPGVCRGGGRGRPEGEAGRGLRGRGPRGGAWRAPGCSGRAARPGCARPAPLPRPLGRASGRLRCWAGRRARPQRARCRCRCLVSGVWSLQQVSGGTEGQGLVAVVRGSPEEVAAGHAGGPGSSGAAGGVRCPRGAWGRTSGGFPREGAGAAAGCRAGASVLVYIFWPPVEQPRAPRVSPGCPGIRGPATGAPRGCATAAARTHVGRAVGASSAPGRPGERFPRASAQGAWRAWGAKGGPTPGPPGSLVLLTYPHQVGTPPLVPDAVGVETQDEVTVRRFSQCCLLFPESEGKGTTAPR